MEIFIYFNFLCGVPFENLEGWSNLGSIWLFFYTFVRVQWEHMVFLHGFNVPGDPKRGERSFVLDQSESSSYWLILFEF